MSTKLANAKKTFETAYANWTADPHNLSLEKVKLSAEVTIKEIEYKICAAKVEALLAQEGKVEDDAQVKFAKAARDNSREERNKAEVRLDEFSKSAAASQGISHLPLSVVTHVSLRYDCKPARSPC